MVNFYNISIPDSSPTFTYSPFREGDVASGWKSFYTGSPEEMYDNTFNNTNRGSGTSSHNTSKQGATFELSFMGTAVYIYGTGSAGAYTTSLDDGAAVTGSPQDGILASYANLEYKTHKLQLTLTQSQTLSLSTALVTVGVGKTGCVFVPQGASSPPKHRQLKFVSSAMVTEKPIDSVKVNADGTSSLNTNYFSTSGSGFNTRGTNDPLAYPRVDTITGGSAIIVRFNSASAIRVYGAVYHDHGTFTAALSPSAGASSSPRTFNATSKWFASDVLLYWESGLDRTQSYTLSLTNGEQNKYLDVHSVVLMDGQGGTDDTATNALGASSTLVNGSPTSIAPSGTGQTNTGDSSGSSSLSTGSIIGIAVGGGVAAIAIFALLLLWCRRRNKISQSRSYQPGHMVKQAPNSPGILEPFIYHGPPSGPSTPSHSRFNSYTDGNSSYYPPVHTYGDSHSALPPHAAPWLGSGGSGSNTISSQSGQSSRKQRDSSGLAPHTPPWVEAGGSRSRNTSAQSLPLSEKQRGSTAPPNTSGSGSGRSESTFASGSGTATSTTRSEARTQSVRRETDAGPVPQHEEGEETVLPPGYDPEWSTGRR
ncbi:hypothetical protein PM082_022537 [Marasmius tenuissimus]|nr:hypothetical protein PM082_022537 [Marasmius tenuissimus]